jgi:hypothetical protein
VLAEDTGVRDRPSRLVHLIEDVLDPRRLAEQVFEVLPLLGDDPREDREVDEREQRAAARTVPGRLLLLVLQALRVAADVLRDALRPPRLDVVRLLQPVFDELPHRVLEAKQQLVHACHPPGLDANREAEPIECVAAIGRGRRRGAEQLATVEHVLNPAVGGRRAEEKRLNLSGVRRRRHPRCSRRLRKIAS